MKIILNVDAIHPPLTGIGHYALQLAKGLRTHPEVQALRYFSGWRWIADPEENINSVTAQSFSLARQWVPFKPAAALAYGWLQRGHFRWKTYQWRDHLVHAPNYILPPWAGPSVATVHDLSHLHYPEHHPKERVLYLERFLPKTLQQARYVITVSESIRQEVHQYLHVPLARIITVHNGVAPAFHPRAATDVRDPLALYGLTPGQYLLSVATLEPRKNLVRLVEAYRQLPERLRQHVPLVLVGANGWLTEALERCLIPLEQSGQIRRLGYVPQPALPVLYAGARGFAYPSLYEGFGLPVLEAMASGVPVLTSDRSSLPEVAGDAAMLVEPEQVDAIASGLERLLEDASWRTQAVAKGLAQAGRFSWSRCVEETVAVYRKALLGA